MLMDSVKHKFSIFYMYYLTFVNRLCNLSFFQNGEHFFLKTTVLPPKIEQLILFVKIRPCFSYKKPTLNTFL